MFFQIGDELPSNPKIQALARRTMSGDLEGLAALGLWALSGATCQASLTDGVVSSETMIANVLNAKVSRQLAGVLVSAGLWHGHGHTCERCPDPPQGSFVFHDWFDLGYDTGADVRATRGKRRELKDRKIAEAVWLRDRIGKPVKGGDVQAACRYCGTLVWRKNRGTWQFDHVHPKLYVGARNIVIVCAACNKQKSQRLPSEAGMLLHKPGWTPGHADWNPQEETKKIEDSLVAEAIGSEFVSPAGTTVPGLAAEAIAPELVSPAVVDREDPHRGLVAEAIGSEFVSPAGTTVPGLAAEAIAPELVSPATEGDPSQEDRPVAGAIGSEFVSPAGTTVPGLVAEAIAPEFVSPAVLVVSDADPDPSAWVSDAPAAPERAAAARIAAAAARIPAAAAATQVSTCARAWQGRAGQGRVKEEEEAGSGRGGGGAGPGAPASPRRRKRGRKRGPDCPEPPRLPDMDPEQDPEPGGVAGVRVGVGVAPEPVLGGEFGSPWFRWRGRPPEVDEAVCERHGEHVPCRSCVREEWVGGFNL